MQGEGLKKAQGWVTQAVDRQKVQERADKPVRLQGLTAEAVVLKRIEGGVTRRLWRDVERRRYERDLSTCEFQQCQEKAAALEKKEGKGQDVWMPIDVQLWLERGARKKAWEDHEGQKGVSFGKRKGWSVS